MDILAWKTKLLSAIKQVESEREHHNSVVAVTECFYIAIAGWRHWCADMDLQVSQTVVRLVTELERVGCHCHKCVRMRYASAEALDTAQQSYWIKQMARANGTAV